MENLFSFDYHRNIYLQIDYQFLDGKIAILNIIFAWSKANDNLH